MSERPLWNGIDGIVFDAVGTLIKPEPSVAEAYTAAARRQGVVLEPEEVRARFHVHFQSDEVHAEQGVLSTDEATERRRWRMIVRASCPRSPNPTARSTSCGTISAGPTSWRCFPDVAPALNALQSRGSRVCVGSNFDGRLRGVVQGLPELAPWLDSLVISSEVGFRKPHPSFFRAACAISACRRSRSCAWATTWRTTCGGRSARGCPALLLDRGAERPADLPHVPNLTALIAVASST